MTNETERENTNYVTGNCAISFFLLQIKSSSSFKLFKRSSSSYSRGFFLPLDDSITFMTLAFLPFISLHFDMFFSSHLRNSQSHKITQIEISYLLTIE